MRFAYWTIFAAVFCCAGSSPAHAQKEKDLTTFWLTDPAHGILFQQQPAQVFSKENAFPQDTVIAIDEKKKYQQVDGFGWCLTGGSAQALMKMSPAARTAL